MSDPALGAYHAAHERMEVRVLKMGPGKASWHWIVQRGSKVLERSADGYKGAEEAFEAGRKVVQQKERGRRCHKSF